MSMTRFPRPPSSSRYSTLVTATTPLRPFLPIKNAGAVRLYSLQETYSKSPAWPIKSCRCLWDRHMARKAQPAARMSTASSRPAAAKSGQERRPSTASPSASVVVISPRNEILLLHRVQKGLFPSAHVFPGGNLSAFHEGSLIPSEDSAERHVDGPGYRLAAIRETFEESGLLLARHSKRQRPGMSSLSNPATADLVQLPEGVVQDGRMRVWKEQIRFEDWLSSLNSEADTDGLIPFTRWITPPNLKRRYTTQMYLYFLPLSADSTDSATTVPADSSLTVEADNTEVMNAEFASAATWIRRAGENEIILFPPQAYILSVLAPFLTGLDQSRSGQASEEEEKRKHAAERKEFVQFLQAPVLSSHDSTWAERVISPKFLKKLPDGRSVLGLDQPGPELRHSNRRGDCDRVVLVGNVPPGPPRNVAVVSRADIVTAKAEPRNKEKL